MVVLDSSFVVAYHNARDIHHKEAVEIMEDFLAGTWGRGLLLEYVFLEVVTVLLARRGISLASNVSTVLLQARELEFVPSSEMFLETLETFRNQGKSKLSFTDSAIVTIARQHDEGFVATFDSDFQDLEGISVIPA